MTIRLLGIALIVVVAAIAIAGTFLPLFDVDEVAGVSTSAVGRIAYAALVVTGICVLLMRRSDRRQ